MRAMLLHHTANIQENTSPLQLTDIPAPVPGPGEILIKVHVCGICHTELDEIEGRAMPAFFPIIPGHQVAGIVAALGPGATQFKTGERVGVAWIYSTCGECRYCLTGQENFCPHFKATGKDANGGYAEYMTIHEDFAYRLPDTITDEQAASLLCAGAIGYRSLKLSNMQDGFELGLTGFGASAHLVMQMAKHLYPHSSIYVFARSEKERAFALQLGADWAGDTDDTPPEKLNCIIDTTPAWKPVVSALANLLPGGRLVINAIRKEDRDKHELLKLQYAEHLWLEKEIKSVANIQRADVKEFLELAARINILPEVTLYPMEEANTALLELQQGDIRGSKVLKISR